MENIKGEGRGLKKEGAYPLSSPEKGGGRLLEGGGYLRGELHRGFTVDSSIVGTVTTIIRVAQSRLVALFTSAKYRFVTLHYI